MIGLFLPNDKRITSKCVCWAVGGGGQKGRFGFSRRNNNWNTQGENRNDNTMSRVQVLALDSPTLLVADFGEII